MKAISHRLCLLTGSHLCHNPRVLKEADTLAAAGYQIQVLGGWLDRELVDRDRELMRHREWNFFPVVDLSGSGPSASRLRVRAKVGRVLGRRFQWQNPWQLGYGAPELLHAARATGAAMFIAHSEQALWVAYRLLDEGCRVGVDMEDWFSEDLMPEGRKHRPVRLLRSLEKALLLGPTHSSCPSRAMSDALVKEFDCGPPTVIYNTFEWSERRLLDGDLKDRKDRRVPSVHWYSQTLGQGRGLEDLLGAIPHLNHRVEIHLRGKPANGFDNWLTSKVPASWRRKIFIHDLVPNHELLSRIAEHDIGFAGEMKYCRSRDLTVTNKILHYLLGGLAVVASDTAGQCEVAEQAMGAVRLYPSGDSLALAEQLNSLLASPDQLCAAKAAALGAAEQTFCWERQVPILVGAIENVLAG